MRDLEYPADARKVVDSLLRELEYDAAFAVLGNHLPNLPVLGNLPDFTTPVRLGGIEQDKAVRRDGPGLLSRFALISMMARFERCLGLLLLQRRVLEELRTTDQRMTGQRFWPILIRVHKESRGGPVKLVKLVTKSPSSETSRHLRLLESVYKVRNCLAHRNGTVEIEDVRPSGKPLDQVTEQDKLRVNWLRLLIQVDGEEVVVGEISDGGTLTATFENYERVWQVGENIQISPAECQGIAITLSVLASSVLSDFESDINSLLGLQSGEDTVRN